MFKFGKRSLKELNSVHPDLQTLFQTVIKYRDCSVVSGLRTQEEQQALYAKGRTQPGDIVTYKDGINRRSARIQRIDGPLHEFWSKEFRHVNNDHC